MLQNLVQTWDLDSFYPGGSHSNEFKTFLAGIGEDLNTFNEETSKLKSPESKSDLLPFIQALQLMQVILNKVIQASSFVDCVGSQDQNDRQAVLLGNKVYELKAVFDSSLTNFDQYLLQIPNSLWDEMMEMPETQHFSFVLNERRETAKEKLSPEMESLVADLAVDGYHAWGELYNTAVSQMSIEFEEKNGEKVLLSMGQADNKLRNADRGVRVEVFKKWETSWSEYADFCANSLNHLAGFRLQLYKHRGWDSFLKEPLSINRMSEQTLNVMWDVIEKNKDIFVTYLERKAKLLGVEGLSWHDVTAPIGQAEKEYPYDEGASIIVEQFRKFSPKLSEFAAMALQNQWIEAEDRAGKSPGGFCTDFPLQEESRIFMTYSGTADNLSTLAHELGHAYHQHVMTDMEPLNQQYTLSVAETASTLAEKIVSDAMVKMATDPQEKLALLERKAQDAVVYFMNIHTRFIFETSFYSKRKDGVVSIDELNELMESAQKKAFRDSLVEYHPHFWASKPHFYGTDVPFYNFPYTFGYLFSAGIYALALKEGASFENKYIDLLRDTGRMTVEELAHKHLGVDLTQPDFWQKAVELSIQDVREFLELSEAM